VARSIARELIVAVAAQPILPNRLRPVLLRRAGLRAHGRVALRVGIRLVGDGRLVLGDDVLINEDCFVDLSADVVLEDGVQVGYGARIITASHELGPSERRAGPFTPRPVVIERGAWLGAGCTVLPGVRVGRGCVIAAGAVVSRDTEPDALYAGVPATLKRRLG
jgi:acetyltransferase-like isoleucine patch superfamily enzyme